MTPRDNTAEDRRLAEDGHFFRCVHEGPVAALTLDVKAIAGDVRTLVTAQASAKGEEKVRSVIRGFAIAVALTVLGFTLNYTASQRSAEALRTQIQTAEKVATALKDVQVAGARCIAYPESIGCHASSLPAADNFPIAFRVKKEP